MTENLITALKRDHRQIERLLTKLTTQPDRRAAVLIELSARLAAHNRAEEERVYPAIAEETGQDDRVHHSEDEHRTAEKHLAELERAGGDERRFTDALDLLVESLRHHVMEEEGTILPVALEKVSADRLVELGASFVERRDEEIARLSGAEDQPAR